MADNEKLEKLDSSTRKEAGKYSYTDPNYKERFTIIGFPNARASEHVLKTLYVKNFKAITETSLPLKPLTAIVGKNSAGKSTLLQAVLAMAQSASDQSVNRSFDFNGKFKQLGTLEQVQNKVAIKLFEEWKDRLDHDLVSLRNILDAEFAPDDKVRNKQSILNYLEFHYPSTESLVLWDWETLLSQMEGHGFDFEKKIDISGAVLRAAIELVKPEMFRRKAESDVVLGADMTVPLKIDVPEGDAYSGSDKLETIQQFTDANISWRTSIGPVVNWPDHYPPQGLSNYISSDDSRPKILNSNIEVTAPNGDKISGAQKLFRSKLEMEMLSEASRYIENDWTFIEPYLDDRPSIKKFDLESYAVANVKLTGAGIANGISGLPEGHPRKLYVENFEKNFLGASPMDAGLPCDLHEVETGLSGVIRSLAQECLPGFHGNSQANLIIDRIEELIEGHSWERGEGSRLSKDLESTLEIEKNLLKEKAEKLLDYETLRDDLSRDFENHFESDEMMIGEVQYQIDELDPKIYELQEEIDHLRQNLQQLETDIEKAEIAYTKELKEREKQDSELFELKRALLAYQAELASYNTFLPSENVGPDKHFISLIKEYLPAFKPLPLEEILTFKRNVYEFDEVAHQEEIQDGLDLAMQILNSYDQQYHYADDDDDPEDQGWQFTEEVSEKIHLLSKAISLLGIHRFSTALQSQLPDYNIFRKPITEFYEFAGWWRDFYYYPEQKPYVEALLKSANIVTDFLRHHIKYLGPIRDPKASRGHSLRDIGENGENAPWVIENLSTSKREYFVPVGTWSASNSDGGASEFYYEIALPERRIEAHGYPASPPLTLRVEVSLPDALSMWLQWFGLASDLYAKSGEFGETNIFVTDFEGVTSHIDNVGVGIRQAYPVILQCLLSKPGDVLLFEQPELHLHPAAEKKMGLFLLEFTKTGRQILLETHGVHLVNSLRTAVAEDSSNQVADYVQLLFAQKTLNEAEESTTNYVISDVNRYGGLSEEWPEGFLDESAKLSSELISAGLAKKKRELEGKKSVSDD